MGRKKFEPPPLPTPTPLSPPPSPPPWNDPHAAVPETISEDDPSTQPMAIPVLDEKAFVEECCIRLNAFLAAAPQDAQHLLGTFLAFQHELASVQVEIQDPLSDRKAGSTVAALFAGILQTRHGDGWCIRPIFLPDPNRPGKNTLARFEAVKQDEIHERKA